MTGIVLQELIQGFNKPRACSQIVDYFPVLPFIVSEIEDHIKAAEIRNRCGRKGIQAGTIDALLTSLCINRDIQILTTDKDFSKFATVSDLKVRA